MPSKQTELYIKSLWNLNKLPFVDQIFPDVHVDHFAVIDLPSKYSGIEYLKKYFSKMGFSLAGEGYIPERINPFCWLRQENFESIEANKTLPQIVIADFELDKLTKSSQKIIEKYSNYNEMTMFDVAELNKRNWPLPTFREYMIIKEENELISWVLVMGRKVNHFGISIHHLQKYKNLKEANENMKKFAKLNDAESEIQGSDLHGIEQSSTMGELLKVQLDGGIIEINNSFLELVWRFSDKDDPRFASDYFNGFISRNANNIIRSIETNNSI